MKYWKPQFGKSAVLAGALLAVAAGPVGAQRAMLSAGSATQAPIVREIDDPSSGARWLLVPGLPGGPGRFLLASGPAGRTAPTAIPTPSAPVLHAGDPVVLEEHSSLVDARLEAVALGPAAPGGPLKVRLRIGGRIVRAIAVGPGKAILAPSQFAPRQEDRP